MEPVPQIPLRRWQPMGWPLPTLSAGNVHVWLVRVDHLRAYVPQVHGWLSAREQVHAAALHTARARERYIAAHGMLRLLLCGYVGGRPGEVALGYGAHGKPHLMGDGAALSFNLSHSDDVALYAFSRGRQIGVDVQSMADTQGTELVARRCFSPREQQALAALPETRRDAAFFTIWARKEAYIKATGLGLALPLDQYTVPLAPVAFPVALPVLDQNARPMNWVLLDLPDVPGYASALAIEHAPGYPPCHLWCLRCECTVFDAELSHRVCAGRA